jgi:hypothetical protein
MVRKYKIVSCKKKGNVCKHYFYKKHRDRKQAYTKAFKRVQNARLDNVVNAKYDINLNAEGIDEADRNAYRRKHRQQISAKKSYKKEKEREKQRDCRMPQIML